VKAITKNLIAVVIGQVRQLETLRDADGWSKCMRYRATDTGFLSPPPSLFTGEQQPKTSALAQQADNVEGDRTCGAKCALGLMLID